MFKFVFLILSISLLSCSAANLPSWPKQFRWFYGGDTSGYNCISVNEPSDPHDWSDNKLCWESGHTNPGIRWSYGGAISGMKCTRIFEPSEPANHHWADNYLCVPRNSPYDFVFSIHDKILGKGCIHMKEPSDPHTWSDNYLCASIGVGPSF